MCFSDYKSIKILTSRKRSMRFQILNKMIDNMLNNKIDKLKLRFRNKEFV